MAGKHFSGKSSKKGSKKPVLITILIVIAVAIIVSAVVLLIPFFENSAKNLPFATHPSITERIQTTTQVNELEQQTTEKAEQTTSNEQQPSSKASQQETADAKSTSDDDSSISSSNSESILVPGDIDNATYFSATYSPYKAVDSVTGEECSLKEVFGSSYGGGTVTFNSDGSFSDTLTTSSSNNGAYAVKDSKLVATYSNDKNMDVSVSSWNGDTPSELIINYGGYDVYLG